MQSDDRQASGQVRAPELEAPLSMEEYDLGVTFEAFLDRAGSNRDRMARIYRQVEVDAGTLEAFRRFGASGGRLYALAEGWCGDCAQVVPVLARVAAEAAVPLVFFERDANPDLASRHRTGGKTRIPLVVAVDAQGNEVGRFVERPAEANRLLRTVRTRQADPSSPAARARAQAELARGYERGGLRAALLEELRAMIGGETVEMEIASPAGRLPAILHPAQGWLPATPGERAAWPLALVAHSADHDMTHPLSRHLCQRLAQRGITAVRFTFAFRLAGRPPSPWAREEALQVEAVLDHLGRVYGVPEESVFLAGEAIGAAAAAEVARRRAVAGTIDLAGELQEVLDEAVTWMVERAGPGHLASTESDLQRPGSGRTIRLDGQAAPRAPE